MHAVAPSRPTQIGEPLESPSYEALFEEARLRARRRRRLYGGVAVVLAVAALAVVANRGGTPRSDGASAHESDAPRLAAAPDPDDSAALVADWGRPFYGWVKLYGDGRVLQQNDGGTILERYLSPVGWDGVRSGEIHLSDFASGYDPDVRESDWWVNPGGDAYVPSTYAICSDRLSVASVAAVANHLPPAVQALLLDPPTRLDGLAAECWKLTSEQALTLVHATDPSSVQISQHLAPLLPDGDRAPRPDAP